MPNSFCHIEIGTRDLETIKRFYETIFDWKINVDPQTGYGLIDTGAPPGGGLFKAPPEVPLGVTAYILVNSIDETLNKIKKQGGKEILGKQEVPGTGCFALFSDPEGKVLGLWQEIKK